MQVSKHLIQIFFEGVRITFLEGDISSRCVDAVVNAANSHWRMGTGVAGALKSRGGIEIEREAMAQGPGEVGDAILTRAGSLPSRHVIHAAAMGPDRLTDPIKILDATTSTLNLASREGFGSLSFPALGTGVGGFPMDRSGELMSRAVAAFLRSTKKHGIEDIEFVLYGVEAYEAFLNGARPILSFPDRPRRR